MTDTSAFEDLRFSSDKLPRRTFAKSLFVPLLTQLSDKGGASGLIGARWADAVAKELSSRIGSAVSTNHHELASPVINAVYRLDTIQGVAARASKARLKNPDFVVIAYHDGQQVVFGVDAKFSIETADESQVSSVATASLFKVDEHLAALLPALTPDARFADGLFASPDYSLTHAMFASRMGYLPVSVGPESVLFVDVDGGRMFSDSGEGVMQLLIELDQLALCVWDSLLATQYYVRLERAVADLQREERLPLLGMPDDPTEVGSMNSGLPDRAAAHRSAWELIVRWNEELEQVRRQRHALQQVIGTPISGPELRDRSDIIMDALGVEDRPSRNQIRKALSRKFHGEVRSRVGVIQHPVDNFPNALRRVATIAEGVSDEYQQNMNEILNEIITGLTRESHTDHSLLA